jgi:hypothetical protein
MRTDMLMRRRKKEREKGMRDREKRKREREDDRSSSTYCRDGGMKFIDEDIHVMSGNSSWGLLIGDYPFNNTGIPKSNEVNIPISLVDKNEGLMSDLSLKSVVLVESQVIQTKPFSGKGLEITIYKVQRDSIVFEGMDQLCKTIRQLVLDERFVGEPKTIEESFPDLQQSVVSEGRRLGRGKPTSNHFHTSLS